MALSINTNIISLNAQNNLSKTQSSLATSLQRLSSGLRINSAADDAAGYAISNRFTSQINGLNQAVRNANDGVSLAQTASGGLQSIQDNLQRIRELAVESANGSNSGVDRASLQAEASQLMQEINRVAGSTQFNGVNLLDGSFKGIQFQVGANVGQTVGISIGNAKTSSLGTGTSSALTATNNGQALGNGDVVLNGTVVGASIASADTASFTNNAASAIAKAAAFNAVSAQTGVTAKADATVIGGASMIGGTAAVGSGTMTINGVDITVSTTADTAATRASVVQAINAVSGKTGVTATDTGSDVGGVSLTAADGRNITVQYGPPASGTNFDASTTGVRALQSNSNAAFSTAGLTGTAEMAVDATAKGTITINNVTTSAIDFTGVSTTDGERTKVVAAINAISDQTGVKAYNTGDDYLGVQLVSTNGQPVNVSMANVAGNTGTFDASTTGIQGTSFTSAKGTAVAAPASSGDAGAIIINGQKTAVVTMGSTASTNATNIINAINAISSKTGVTASGDSTGISLTSVDGRAINLSYDTAGGANLKATDTGLNQTFPLAANTSKTFNDVNMQAVSSNSSGVITINGISTQMVSFTAGTDTTASQRQTVIDAINKIAGQTGVTASDTGSDTGGVRLTAADGRHIDVSLSGVSGTFDSSATGLNTALIGDINNSNSTLTPTFAAGSDMTGAAVASDSSGTININGVDTGTITFAASGATTSAQRQAVVTAINAISAKTGVIAEDTGSDTKGVELVAANGQAISVSLKQLTGTTFTSAATGVSTNGASAVATTNGSNTAQGTAYGTVTLSSDAAITVSQGSSGSNLSNAGLTVGSYTNGTAYVSSTSNNGQALESGAMKINGTLVGASLAAYDTSSRYDNASSAIAKAAAINAVTAQTGVTASVNANTVSGASMTPSVTTGSLTINGVSTAAITTTADGASSRAAVIQAINAISGQTGVTALDTNSDSTGIQLTAADGRNVTVQFNDGLTSASTGVAGTTGQTSVSGTFSAGSGGADFTLNGVHITSGGVALTSAGDLKTLINNVTSQTGVTATVGSDGTTITLATANGQAIDLSGTNLEGLTAKDTAGSDKTSYGTYTLSSASSFTVAAGTVGGLENSGMKADTYGSGKTGESLDQLDLSTADGANKALTAIDNAISQVNSQAGALGAYQNRFTATVSNLQSTALNLTSARSQIQDTDFAAETANLSRSQILQQAGTAMLAQANQLGQSVLSLLR